MQKHWMISLVAAALLSGGVANADTPTEAFNNGKVSGQIRLFYIDRSYDGSVTVHRTSFAGGGHLKYETGAYHGLSAGVAFYTTNHFGIGANDLPGDVLDPSLFGENLDGYTIFGEAYLQYRHHNTLIKVGRQRLDTPMAGSDDARMLPNLFEAYLVSNTDLQDTVLVAAHVTKFAAGSFSNVYKGGALAATAGYSVVNAESGRFMNMGAYALGKKTDGVSVAAAIYKGLPNTTLQIWDYLAHDIVNIIYAQGDYKVEAAGLKLSAQYIHESDAGDSLAGSVDSDYVGLKAGVKVGGVSGYVAYSTTSSDSANPLGASTLSVWGGMPAFTQGMVTRHQFLADTDAWKMVLAYNFKEQGIPATAALYHASFDVGADNPYKNKVAWTAKESGFDIKYYPASVKNLQLRFRGNFPRDFAKNLDWDEYRFIVNYNF